MSNTCGLKLTVLLHLVKKAKKQGERNAITHPQSHPIPFYKWDGTEDDLHALASLLFQEVQ